jgi:hypothetical protein
MKEKIKKIALSLVIIGLFIFWIQGMGVGFANLISFGFSKIQSVFKKEKTEDELPASVLESLEDVSIEGIINKDNPDREQIIKDLGIEFLVSWQGEVNKMKERIGTLEKQVRSLSNQLLELEEEVNNSSD